MTEDNDFPKRLTNYFEKKAKEQNPYFSLGPKQYKIGYAIFKKMIEQRKIPAKEIKLIIEWSFNDDFWKATLKSIPQFRDSFDSIYPRASKEINKENTMILVSNDLARHMEVRKELRNVI